MAKTHKQVTIPLTYDEVFCGIPLEEGIKRIREAAVSIVDPVLDWEWDDPCVRGWLPLTPAEVARKAAASARAKAAADKRFAKKEAAEREQARKLLAKYPDLAP